jgi:transposase
MFFKTSIKQKDGGHEYTHYRLCESYREGRFIRNRTLLSLGDLESVLPPEKIPFLCKRINQVYLEGKTFIISSLRDDKVEALCTKYVGLLHEAQKIEKAKKKAAGIEQVYIDRTTNSDIREVGGEWLCLQACRQLLLPEYFETFGWEKQDIALALTQIIARAVYPASEFKTSRWLKENSALCELTGVDPSAITKDKLYQMAHRLYDEKDGLERHFSNRTNDLFSLDDKIIIYDLTNTYFEGAMRESRIAKFGRSKEKRNDARQVVLAVVVNPEGFLKESQIFEGNMTDPESLQYILDKMKSHRGRSDKKQVVVMDAGIATNDNLKILKEESFDYICVSRGKLKEYRATSLSPVEIRDKSNQLIEISQVEVDGESDSFYKVKSYSKGLKEASMENRFTRAFECGLSQAAEALKKKGGTKKLEKVWERIGRLKEKYPSVHRLYQIHVEPDERGIHATSISWERIEAKSESRHGEYFLRTSLSVHGEEITWLIYNTIREVESTFRCLKTDLNLRPVFHKTDEATMAHLHLGLLAYQLVSTIRYKLKQFGITHEWREIVRIMNTQKMVTTHMVNTDEECVSIRKCSLPESKVRIIYKVLGYDEKPFIRKKSVVPQLNLEKNIYAGIQGISSG